MLLSLLTLLIFFVATNLIAEKLKISSLLPGYFTAILIATGWITPVVMGGLQGLELFGWITSISVFTGILKLGLAFNFVILGFNIGGALAAFLLSSLIGITLTILPLRKFISLKKLPGEAEDNNSCEVNFSEVFFYLFPVAISSLCFIGLVSMDMVLVKYYFGSGESGLYALAQMVGKIFLFLPGAISMVMFPHTSRLNAKQMDTSLALRRSILYAVLLCSIVVIGYNTFPTLILRILTGKVFTESIILGRLFSISMSFFALVFIFITYFLSLKDYRFIKYLAVSALLQFFAIVLFHNNLLQIQLILCLNSILLFLIHLFLHIRKA
jgi:O-antigen/teichoic acid export membrane protein